MRCGKGGVAFREIESKNKRGGKKWKYFEYFHVNLHKRGGEGER